MALGSNKTIQKIPSAPIMVQLLCLKINNEVILREINYA